MTALATMLKNKWLTLPASSTESFHGRTVLVTGATSGIGYAAALKFAQLGASKVIISARDAQKGAETKARLEVALGHTGQFTVWELDMSSNPSVVAFAHRANTELGHLDIAILNAGVRKVSFITSPHGWEEDLQVNLLSTILLGILLLPKLKASKTHTGKIPVLQFVNSGSHVNAIIPPSIRNSPSILSAYNDPANFSPQTQYAHTKLLLMHATTRLAASIPSNSVIITSVCPGMVATNLARDSKIPGFGVLLAVMRVTVQRSPEQGANTYVSGAAQHEGLHGRFWKNDVVQPVGRCLVGAENEELGKRVWEEVRGELKDVEGVGEIA